MDSLVFLSVMKRTDGKILPSNKPGSSGGDVAFQSSRSLDCVGGRNDTMLHFEKGWDAMGDAYIVHLSHITSFNPCRSKLK